MTRHALFALALLLPAQAFAWTLGDLASPYDDFLEFTPPDYSLFYREIDVVNDGVYPLTSIVVNGQEQLAPGYILPPGAALAVPGDLFVSTQIEVVSGTSCPNVYGACGVPLFQRTYPAVLGGDVLYVPDWEAKDVLAHWGSWSGFWIDANFNYVDTTFTFYGNGQVSWWTSNAGTVWGNYWDQGANPAGVSREVGIEIGGERDVMRLLEYEGVLNVWIAPVGSWGRWVTHTP